MRPVLLTSIPAEGNRKEDDCKRAKLEKTAPKGGASRDPARRARGTRLLLMPFTGFIPDTLMAYPRPCAARLFDMIVKRLAAQSSGNR